MVLEIRMTLLPEFVYDTVTKAAYVRAGDEARHKARASTPLSPCFLCCPPRSSPRRPSAGFPLCSASARICRALSFRAGWMAGRYAAPCL